MTLGEFLKKPIEMDLFEYQDLLKRLEYINKKIRKICSDIDFEETALEILTDEADKDRYNEHLVIKTKLEKSRDRYLAKANDIKNKIHN